jgi:PAS domain S-box-containing protein
VEDSEADAELLLRELRRGGYEATGERVDTAAALAAALTRQQWDVVTCDYVMPHLSASGALKLIQEQTSNIPIIIVSGQVDEEVAVSGTKAGAWDFVSKHRLARLCPAVERALKEAEAGRARKRTEAAVRQLVAIVESSDDAIVGKTLEGIITSWNPAAHKIYGYTPEEAIGQPISMLVPREYRHEMPAILDRIRRGGRLAHFETVRVCKDGRHVHVSLTVSPITDGCGKVVGASAIARDITERRRGEEALRASEAKMRLIFNSMNDSVVIHDRQGRFLEVNQITCERLGYTREEMLQMTPRDVVAPDPATRVSDRIHEVLEVGSAVFETAHKRRDGTVFPVEVSSRLIDYEGTPAILSIARDITERKALEEQLRHSQKMEAVGLLAGSLAHDFNNQLTIVKGSAQFLLGALPINDPSRRDVQRICATVDRGASLIRQLLAFSRRQAIQISPVDLTQLVSEEAAMFRLLLGEQIDLQMRLAPNLRTALADPARIDQVLMNLVANARDAMPAAGCQGRTLTVETANVDVAEGGSRAFGENIGPGQYVMLAISDTGCGMPPEVRERIFEPFYTTKESGKGTGLGLSTAYGIVKQHRGYIVCVSEPGRGTTFQIYLPCADSNRQSGMEAGDVVPFSPWSHSGATVLVAEDEEGVREVVAEALTHAGYAVRVAGGVAQALAVAKHDPIHLLVTDLVMQDGSGQDLACQLAQTNPMMKVLFMSGYSQNLVVDWRLQGTGFLQKPFDLDNLVCKAQEILETRTAESLTGPKQ